MSNRIHAELISEVRNIPIEIEAGAQEIAPRRQARLKYMKIAVNKNPDLLEKSGFFCSLNVAK